MDQLSKLDEVRLSDNEWSQVSGCGQYGRGSPAHEGIACIATDRPYQTMAALGYW